jgi:hypothetical protein
MKRQGCKEVCNRRNEVLEFRAFCFASLLVFDYSRAVSKNRENGDVVTQVWRIELTMIVDHILDISENLSIPLLRHACLLPHRSTIRLKDSRGLGV